MAQALVSCAVTSLSFCLCTACTSLLTSCCGNDKPSTTPPSVTSGRKRSVGLLGVAIVVALGFQYGAAPAIVDNPGVPYLYKAWTSGCDYASPNGDAATSDAFLRACAGNSGAYRSLFAATVFFLLAAVAARCKATANREAWPAKIVLFLFGVLAMVFVPNSPLFDSIYLNIARIGGVLFILVQQLMVVDMSHNWNNSWVEKSNQAEEQERGSGKKWLVAILLSCLAMFALTIAALVYLFVQFTGCPTNNAFIAVTLVGIVAVTAAQLTGEEGSLLSSAVVSLWATYLAYSAVTKNPDQECNPALGLPTVANIVLGLFVCVLGLGYTGWSCTAEDKLSASGTSSSPETSQTVATATGAGASGTTTPYQAATDAGQGPKKVTGVVVSSSGNNGGDAADEEAGQNGNSAQHDADDDDENHPLSSDPGTLSNSWRLNAILATICCWTAVVLTEWGSVKGSGDVANPQTGNVAMWMVVASQWVVLVLYTWTLVAPRLFPNRDFS